MGAEELNYGTGVIFPIIFKCKHFLHPPPNNNNNNNNDDDDNNDNNNYNIDYQQTN